MQEVRSSERDRQIGSTNPVLTAIEIAHELRCSKAHAYRLMNGKVNGVSPLPTIRMGRKYVVQRSSLDAWKRANESHVIVADDSEVDAVDALNKE